MNSISGRRPRSRLCSDAYAEAWMVNEKVN
jgi:hypothetical protein